MSLDLKKMRCAVIGGGGFIGTNLCRNLIKQTQSVKAFGRRKNFPEALKDVQWLNGDFNDPADLALAVEGCDTVFHLVNASTPASANADKVSDARSAIISTIHLLEICRNHNVKRLIFLSSGGTVYGIKNKLPISESDETWPISAYGVSKLAVEKYLHLYEYLHNLDYRVLRVSNPFGPFQTGNKNQGIIAVFLGKILRNQPIEVWGDGMICRDYIYIDDLVEAIALAAIHDGSERIFNIGSGIPRSINSIIEAIAGIFSGDVVVHRREGRSVDVPANYLNIDKARSALGWTPRTDFADGLRLTQEWMREYINI